MEDGGGVVHGAKGVNHDGETFFLETMTYLRSKTRAYEEKLFTRANPETRIRDIDDRSKFHFRL